MRITKIESQKKNPKRKNIFADDEFVIGVSDETLIRAGLRTGDEISDEKIKTLVQEEEVLGAKRVALRFLAHRQRTEKEIRDKLRQKEFGDGNIRQTIESLKRAGLINDAEFARMFVRDALSARATGQGLLKRKLLLLGIDKAIVEEVLAEVFTSVDQKSDALEAGKKFLRKSTATHRTSNVRQLRHRLSTFLMRRGFGWDTVEPVIKELMKEVDE